MAPIAMKGSPGQNAGSTAGPNSGLNSGPNPGINLGSGDEPGAVVTGRVVAIVGNPNVGKTTLFNRLAGRRQQTANYHGTTQEAHVGAMLGGAGVTLVDLPGIYGLALSTGESAVCRGVLSGRLGTPGVGAVLPAAVLFVIDARQVSRGLVLLAEVASLGRPVAVALTMIEEAARLGLRVDRAALAGRLGCPVVEVGAEVVGLAAPKAGAKRGVASVASPAKGGPETVDAGTSGPASDLAEHSPRLTARIEAALAAAGPVVPEPPDGPDRVEAWADGIAAGVTAAGPTSADPQRLGDALDSVLTHPIAGVAVFAALMTGLFWAIFSLAAYPMDWIDAGFSAAAGLVRSALPVGALRDLLADGVILGVGATVVFLPQILVLFFLIALLEESGYLARAAFVIDRVLRPFGLPGHAFVPLLSGHACAIPGIMAARSIPDARERLATILVLPFMSCSARIPVYVLVTRLLFPGDALLQALAFSGCYALGIAAGLLSALVARGSILRGRARGMAIEMPPYRPPSPLAAARIAAGRGAVFLRKAGTVILAISVLLWWLSAYPRVGPTDQAQSLRDRAAQLDATADATPRESSNVTADAGQSPEALRAEADRLDAAAAASGSFLGRIGSWVRPVFSPMGADAQLTVGILASFAAREVFVTTMAVQVVGDSDIEADDPGLLDTLARAQRADGTPLFTPAASWAVLVYFVLAMQCLPTLAVTAREAGGVRWALLQFGWMTLLAYGGGCAAYAIASALTQGLTTA